jgi:excisionase family DNA binding protein
MNNTNRKTITTDDACELLGIKSRVTIIKLINEGHLEAYRLTPGETSPWRIYADSVVKFARDKQRRQIVVP